MARVTVEDCIDKVENRFDLVLLASHRARMISSGAQITVERDNAGTLIGFRGDAPAVGAARRESFIHIHVERIEDELRRAQAVHALELVLADVRVVVQDWRPMLTRVGELIADIRNHPPHLTVDEVAEAVQFLEWLVANNFTFLGIREYAFAGGEGEIAPKFETGLGILRGLGSVLMRSTSTRRISSE